MKRFITCLCFALIAAASCAFAACGSGTAYEGEYHYNSYNTEYGVKVKVTVDGDTISKVEIVDSDYKRVSDANADYGWTEEKRQVYLDSETTLLKQYEGKTVAEVKAASASVSGQDGATANYCDSAYLLSGCTQSSARLLKAVQNALSKI